MAYYAFPQEHWRHLRTTNVIESPFAAVRLRTTAATRFKKVENATALIWKTLLVVEQHFRKLNAPHRCPAVHDGTVYRDGQRAITTVVKSEPGSRVWGTATHVFVLTDAAVLHGIR